MVTRFLDQFFEFLQQLPRVPFIWGQIYLIVAVAFGLSHLELVVFSWVAEYIVILLFSVLLFTRGWRKLLFAVMDLLAKSLFLAFAMLIVLAVIRGSKNDNHAVYLGDLWGTMALIAIYCMLTLAPAIWRTRSAEDPAKRWNDQLDDAMVPMVTAILISIMGGHLVVGLAGKLSAPMWRLTDTALVTLIVGIRILYVRLGSKTDDGKQSTEADSVERSKVRPLPLP